MSPSDRQIAADLVRHGIHVTTLDQLAMPLTDKLRAEATIVWRNDELKKAYEQALAQRQASGSTPQTSAQN